MNLEEDRTRIFEALAGQKLVCGSVEYETLSGGDQKRSGNSLPLVSVVTVTFNASANVEAAIKSISEQTYPGPIEYIVIDGGSTDGTIERVKKHGDVVDCLISEPDNGIYDAMNKGLLRARGKYVALLNSDDSFYPDFIKSSVEALEESGADISYCDYKTEKGPIDVGVINDGIFVAQLGIKHNTFLFKSDCFEKVGRFDASYKIVADAKWNRAAYASGLKFVKAPGRHVFYSSQGLSSSSTDTVRNRVISESSNLLSECFPCLDKNQARQLYLSNFDAKKASIALDIAKNQGGVFTSLKSAVKFALEWNFLNRPGYFLNPKNSVAVPILKAAVEAEFPLDKLVVSSEDKQAESDWTALLSAVTQVSEYRKNTNRNVVIHFTKVFSAPSETFIFDLLNDLSCAENDNMHVVLCDIRKEAENRPYHHVLTLPWDQSRKDLRSFAYKLIWQVLEPQKVIAHFALNGWWLHDRLEADQYDLPWVNMCHGIDVFSARDNEDYHSYLTEYCADASNVAFTAVSSFLKNLLVEVGIPEEKVFSVPNSVDPSFQDFKKVEHFWKKGRPLRIVTVGRLIKWKGHDHLLRAIAELKKDPDAPEVEVEIIFGRWRERLDVLEKLARSLGVDKCIKFVDFVDFKKRPDYLSQFDLFVLPSTLSNDSIPRTETFGVAMIEAIASGLPVIGTDAGGIPEVVGADASQAKIVPHGDPIALKNAILDMVANAADVFCDNGEYARSRLAQFSSNSRLTALAQVQKWFDLPRIRVLHFCALGLGGAAGASLNVHRGLLRRGFDSRFVTRPGEIRRMRGYTPNVLSLPADNSVDFEHSSVPGRSGLTTFSLDNHAIPAEDLLELVQGADLINITWPAKFLSVENIATLTRLGVPVTITLRDMNAITGGCHFFHGCNGWQSGCNQCPQLQDNEDDYPAIVLSAKKAAWNLDAVTFVALSEHSERILAKSSLAEKVRRTKISNYVNCNAFYHDPHNKLLIGSKSVQKKFKLGYLPSFSSRIKGHEKFLTSLQYLHQKNPDLELAVVVAATKNSAEELLRECPFEVVQFEPFRSTSGLREYYNCLDAVIVPSLEETFSNTTVEALACGKPVVGFDTGVLGEVLTDDRFGQVVRMGDAYALADAIKGLITKPRDSEFIASETARSFSEANSIDGYESTFRSLIDQGVQQVPFSDDAREALTKLGNAQLKRKAKNITRRHYCPENSPANLELLADWELLELASQADLNQLDWKKQFLKTPWNIKRWRALRRYERRRKKLGILKERL